MLYDYAVECDLIRRIEEFEYMEYEFSDHNLVRAKVKSGIAHDLAEWIMSAFEVKKKEI